MPNLNNLSVEDKRKLALALAEMKVRGIPIPATLVNPAARSWPVDENGYFLKRDGKHYKIADTDEDKKKFIASTARFLGLSSGRGGGKSGAGAQKACIKIASGESGAVINPDFENFRYSTWPEFREWIPWGMVIPSQRHRSSPAWQPRQPFVLVFVNGAKVYCKGLKDPDSARGPNLNWLWYDEGSRDETGMSWNIALASVRVGKNPTAFTTFTPRGKDHWTYQFFVKQQIPDEIKALLPSGKNLIEMYYTSIEQNKDNLDPGFYASMLAAYPTGWMRDQELYGKFVEEGGVLGDPAWFLGHYLPTPLPDSEIKKRIRYWDFAASEKDHKNKDPDSTTGTLMSWSDKEGDKYFIDDQVSGQWKWEDIKRAVVRTALEDGPFIDIYIEQEPGSGGKNQIAEIAALDELKGYRVKEHIPEGDKIQRANTWFADAALGRFYMVKGPWNESFTDQLSSFPRGRHDDKIDGVSGARQVLNPVRRWRKISYLSMSDKCIQEIRLRQAAKAKVEAEEQKPKLEIGVGRL